MALVRRSTVMGHPGVYVGHAAGPGMPPAPTTPAAAPPPAGTGAGTDGPGAEVPASPAAPAQPDAAAHRSKPASPLAVLGAFALIALGAAGGYAMIRWGNHATPFRIGNQTSAYAAAAAFAAAMERVLEPFAQWLPGNRLKARYEAIVAAMANRDPLATLEAVAAAKARMDRSTANRAVMIWGLAAGAATVLSAASGFFLLHMIAAADWNPAAIPLWVDAAVTGVVVGTGTKPLHDLISRWQNNRGGTGTPVT